MDKNPTCCYEYKCFNWDLNPLLSDVSKTVGPRFEPWLSNFQTILPTVYCVQSVKNLMNSVTCHLPHEFIADENILAQIVKRERDSQEQEVLL